MESEAKGQISRSRPLNMSGLDADRGMVRSGDQGSGDSAPRTRDPPHDVASSGTRFSRMGLDTLKVEDLPDMEEVQRDVASIVGSLRTMETGDPGKDMVDAGINDLKRSVATVKSILHTARFDLEARQKGYFTRDMDKLSGDVRRLVRDIERFERSRVSREPTVPNMEEVDRDVNGIQNRSESIINQKKEVPQPLQGTMDPSVRQDRPRGKKWKIWGFELEPVTFRMIKRFVPILFGILAFVAYAVVLLRVLFDLRISHLVPFFIDPSDIFILLVVVLGITVLANIVHRLRIQYAKRRGDPIWDGGGKSS